MSLFYKKLSGLILLSCLVLLLSDCKQSKAKFSKDDVAKSLKIIGIEFNKKYIDTLYPYLERNKEGFDSLRKYILDRDVFPAIRFNPSLKTFLPNHRLVFQIGKYQLG